MPFWTLLTVTQHHLSGWPTAATTKLLWSTAHFHAQFTPDKSESEHGKVRMKRFCMYSLFVQETPGLRLYRFYPSCVSGNVSDTSVIVMRQLCSLFKVLLELQWWATSARSAQNSHQACFTLGSALKSRRTKMSFSFLLWSNSFCKIHRLLLSKKLCWL